jgi:hypothetical protein
MALLLLVADPAALPASSAPVLAAAPAVANQEGADQNTDCPDQRTVQAVAKLGLVTCLVPARAHPAT